MQYVSVQEFARMVGKSETYIRKLCRQNKLQYIQEQLESSTTLKYMIDINTPEAQKQLNGVTEISEPVPEVQNQKRERVLERDETILELTEKIEQISRIAGKVELLEDSRKTEKENVTFWQNKYFEKESEVTELKVKVAELTAELERKKPFWKKL